MIDNVHLMPVISDAIGKVLDMQTIPGQIGAIGGAVFRPRIVLLTTTGVWVSMLGENEGFYKIGQGK